VSGNWTFGQVAAQFAIETAVRKALASGIAAVSLVQSHHIGRLGHYAEYAAEHAAVALIWAGGYSEHEPRAAPYGGRRRLLSTNPVALGFPGGAEGALVADFATTGVATSRVVQARERGEQLPAASIVDRDGEPTSDPGAFFDGGAHLPFGGHKGYAVMLAAEWLGRIFTGADDFADTERGGPIYGHQGVAMLTVRADLFTPLPTFRRRSDEMIRRAHDVPPAAGFERVLVPGEPERASRERRRTEGIALTEDVWAAIEGLVTARDRSAAARVDG
jgi:LDH2 family malate/lactate/ureidoglycolate dehydrogenase